MSPALAAANNGNWRTARRWQRFLSWPPRIIEQWPDEFSDRDRVMLALHARRSSPSIIAWREMRRSAGLAVILTGTDLYRDIGSDVGAQRSLHLACLLYTSHGHEPSAGEHPAGVRRLGPGSAGERAAPPIALGQPRSAGDRAATEAAEYVVAFRREIVAVAWVYHFRRRRQAGAAQHLVAVEPRRRVVAVGVGAKSGERQEGTGRPFPDLAPFVAAVARGSERGGGDELRKFGQRCALPFGFRWQPPSCPCLLYTSRCV